MVESMTWNVDEVQKWVTLIARFLTWTQTNQTTSGGWFMVAECLRAAMNHFRQAQHCGIEP
jgi:hypothetical protein